MHLQIYYPLGEYITQNFSELLKKSPYTLIYFYPKDNTPGCTLQAQDYSELIEDFKEKGIQIFGCSGDSLESHEKFTNKCQLNIPLISDPDKELINHFNVIGERNLYGKLITGLIRSTFLLDQKGEIIQEWRNVRAKGNAAKVLREIK